MIDCLRKVSFFSFGVLTDYGVRLRAISGSLETTGKMSTTELQLPSVLSRVVQSSSHPGRRDETLALIAHAAKDCIPGVDSASITARRRDGGFETLAASDELASSADSLQYELGEGPCLDAVSGEPMVYCRYLGVDPRYRRYGPHAGAQLGVVSQLAFNVSTVDRAYGALNLYSRSQHMFEEYARSLAELFAHQTAAAMGYAASVSELNEALGSRVGQAVGIITQRHSVDENVAFGLLTELSQTSDVTLPTVAAEIVASANDEARARPATIPEQRRRSRSGGIGGLRFLRGLE